MKFLKLLAHAIRDRWRLTHPRQNLDSLYGFAFIVHPRGRADVRRKYPFMKWMSDAWVDAVTRRLWPVVVSEVTGLTSVETGKPVRGWVIAAPLTAEQMTKERALA